MSKFKSTDFYCPACHKLYIKGYTRTGVAFINHQPCNCKYSDTTYIGKSLQLLLAKGGEEDVALVDRKES